MKTLILTTFFLLTLILTISCEIENSRFVEAKTKLFAECNKIHNLDIFIRGIKGEEFVSEFQSLKITELDSLINLGSPIEKVYSFWAISRKNPELGEQYLPKVLTDTNKVKTYQIACSPIPPIPVANHCKDISQNINQIYGSYQFNQFLIDSLAIQLKWNLRLLNMNPNPLVYKLLRNNVIKTKNPYAIIALSRFRNENDLHFIESLLNGNLEENYFGIKCIKEFPHPEFEKHLVTTFYGELNEKAPIIINDVYQAIVKYESDEINIALNQLVSNPKKYNTHIAFTKSIISNPEFINSKLSKLINEKIGAEKVIELIDNFNWKKYHKESEIRMSKIKS